MPAPSTQWVKLPPNLVHDKSTKGKSIYQTDYNSRRPMFQIAMQKGRLSSTRSSHHPQPPKDRDRKTVRMSQTGDYMTLQDAFAKDFAATGNKSNIRLKTTQSPNMYTPAGTDSERAVLNKYIRPSLQLVEQSWMDEAHATKRDRDRLYQEGVAGTKLGLQTRPTKKEEPITQQRRTIADDKSPLNDLPKFSRHRVSFKRLEHYKDPSEMVEDALESKPKPNMAKNAKGLPGLSNWLKSSNEYEKAVVFNFMDTVAKATKPPQRPATPQRMTLKPVKPDLSNEYYHRYIQRPKSVRSQRVTDKPQLPPRPSSVSAMRHEVDTWTGAPAQEHGHPGELTETHHYYPPPHIHHTEGKCEVCDYYRVKKLLELIKDYDPSKLGETTMSHLLRPRVDPALRYPDEDTDYVHDNSFFSLTNARDRGYFIIAPDWVSERKGITRPRYK